ncbi:hypothetical protein N7509_014273 [Penicillium cosmopolitanum]|uniref:AB hydrolase-1 domain-containing protein n=1 Tax=Penicillium cosmopolitanum TaxID=1131564 RepID=A0A9W9S094_9EURO|nr:uncharacterized protein N7509_014273 [Penicillium cosmopolitanum]KAJ5369661.1 hypothetical protein N7509_014273 [Penicillium cosmopolitanum]
MAPTTPAIASRCRYPQAGAFEQNDKRRLLLIYIHGFMGSEASFQEFPAHIHDMLTALLSDSHVVYTRIYPRYKSHGEIQSAAAQFSAWLAPHEADDLDIILLGHSLGGIVAADVALLQKHQILGLINFDVPFLGLHPRVVPTGILSSMPKKPGDVAPEETLADEQASLGMDPAYKPATPPRPAAPDPNFDRPWRNDIRLPNRGFLKGVMHFVNKNTDNLARSVFDRVVSSAKFAGCVNNYSELRRRYRHLMELEASNRVPPHSIKFINYYTASTGRKKPKKGDDSATKTDSAQESPSPSLEVEEEEITGQDEKSTTPTQQTPAIERSLENMSISSEPRTHESGADEAESTVKTNPVEESQSKSSSTSTLAIIDAEPIPEPSIEDETTSESQIQTPEPTQQPLSPTPSETLREASLHLSESTTSGNTSITTTSSSNSNSDPSTPKLRKFILLPKNHWKYHDNAHWTAVVMQDIDEVEAHQSMFIPSGAHYDPLVGDTVSLIETWVQDELSRRLVRESLD